MKFNTQDLKDAIKMLENAISKNSQLSALQGILFKENTLIAYNLEIAIIANLDIQNVNNESFIIPPKVINLIKTVNENEIDITEKNNKLTVKFGKSRINNSTFNITEFVELPTFEIANEFEVNANEFINAVNCTNYCISKTDTKPIFKGLLAKSNNGLDIVACDGFRLSKSTIKCAANNINDVLTFEFISILSKMKFKDDEVVKLTQNRKYIQVKVDNFTVLSRKLEGEFIDYQKAIPNNTENTIIANRREILEIVNRIKMIDENKSKNPIVLKISNDILTFSFYCATSEIEENIDLIQSSFTEEFIIGVSAKLLYETLSSYDCENITFEFINSLSPILISENKDVKIDMVLPIRLKAK